MFRYKSIYIYITQNNNIKAIKEVRELFNELRSNLSHEETKRIRKKLHKKGNCL